MLTVMVVVSLAGERFPFGILLVNIVGSFAIGWIAAFTGPGRSISLSKEHRQFLMAGICGGFTTYSFFILGVLVYLQDGAVLWAILYICATICSTLLAVWAGYTMGSPQTLSVTARGRGSEKLEQVDRR